MTPAEYAAFVDETRAAHDDETAAAIIEARCRGPYKPPRPSVLFPRRSPEPTAGDVSPEGDGTLTGALGDVS